MEILNKYFQSHMILQSNVKQKIFGNYKGNKEIKIKFLQGSFLLQEVDLKVNHEGDFFTYLKPQEPSFKNFQIEVIVDGEIIEIIEKIVFGDVYILAGQSNMAFGIENTNNKDIFDKIKINDLDVRTCQLYDDLNSEGHISRPHTPLKEVKSIEWVSLKDIDKRKHISAIGLMLALDLCKHYNYPIGLIQVAVGGSSIDSWLDIDTIINAQDVYTYLQETNKYALPQQDEKPVPGTYTKTSGIFNEKIAPLKDIKFNTLMWYQGENSVNQESDAIYYKQALDILIKSYRKHFGFDFNFIAIQLASHNYYYANYFALPLINEAIKDACMMNHHATYIPIHDQIVAWYDSDLKGASNPIHPTNKGYIAHRIFTVITQGDIIPGVEKVEYHKNNMTVRLNRTFDKLMYNKPVIGFSIADKDKVFHPAEVRVIDDYTLVLNSKYVLNPIYINYGMYLFNDDLSIKNAYGIPLAPFRNHNLSIHDATYFSHNKYFNFENNEVFVNYFTHEHGFSEVKEVYTTEAMNQLKDVRFDFHKDTYNELHIQHSQNKHELAYFGISPIIDYPGYINQFDQYEYVNIDCKMIGDNQTVFVGILIQIGNQTYLFKNEKVLTQEYQTFEFKLSNALSNDLTPIKLSKQDLKHMSKLQFLFKDPNDGVVSIKSFELHN